MIDSRDPHELLVPLLEKYLGFKSYCLKQDVSILVTSTFRDKEAQDKLYSVGRTIPGHIVTNAKGGESFHQYRVAFDCYPIVLGKPLWNVFYPDGSMIPQWQVLEEAAKSVGLEWAGNWHSFKEYAHFQDSLGKIIQQWKDGD